MASITTRSGKGSALTSAEVDANFTNINSDKAEKSVTLSAGTGLTGGGDLSANRSFALSTSGVTAASYGGNNSIPSLTIDAYGRITLASAVTPSGTWGISINGNSATVTNGVYTTGNQTIAGVKTFSNNLTITPGILTLGTSTIDGVADANWGVLYRPSKDGLAGAHGFLNAAGAAIAYVTGTGDIVASGLINATALAGAAATGTGASGTWGISISGSAATLTTARTLTIGSTGKTFNGSANVSWSLAEIGAQAALGFTPLNSANPSYTGTLTGSTGILNIGSGQIYKDASGNVGFGATPSTWSGYTGLQVKSTIIAGIGTSDNALFGSNVYYDGSAFRYIAATTATLYRQLGGAHSWHTASAGTAGNSISFTQLMSLDSSGLQINGNTNLNGGYTEKVFAITDGAVNLDPNNGAIQTWTLGASRTPGQVNWAAGQSITLMIDDGAAYTITWTTLGVVWESNGGTAPPLASTGYTTIVLWKVGTTIYGARVGDV